MFASLLLNRGRLYQLMRQVESATTAFAAGLKVQTRLAKGLPNQPEAQNVLAEMHVNLGALLGSGERIDEAEHSVREADNLLATLANALPSSSKYQRNFAVVHYKCEGTVEP